MNTELAEKINKLKKAIASPATPENLKASMKVQLEKLESQANQKTDTKESELERLKKELANAEKLNRNPNFTGVGVPEKIEQLKKMIAELEPEDTAIPYLFAKAHTMVPLDDKSNDFIRDVLEELQEQGEMDNSDAQGLEELYETDVLWFMEKGKSAKWVAKVILAQGSIPAPAKTEAKDEPVTKTLTFFKGTDHKYENQYLLNKAIEELLDEATEGYEFNSDEKQFMFRYSGMGGLEKFGATGAGLLYEYYTPEECVKKMWALAYKYGYKNGKVLEPSAAIGRFFKYAPSLDVCTGYEINKYTARIAHIIFPEATIIEKPFETIFIKDNNSIKGKVYNLPKYELVIGNPPYGDLQGKYFGMGEKSYTKAHNYIEYFITRGLDLLVPGGLLIFIVGAEIKNGGKMFLASGETPCKKEIAEKGELVDAYRLPSGIFENTQVTTEIVIIRKK